MSFQTYPKHEILKDQEEPDETSKKNTTDIEMGINGSKQENQDQICILRNYDEPYQRHFGKYHVFKIRDNEPQIAIGPHWPLFIFAYGVIMFSGFYLIYQTFIRLSWIYKLASIFSTFFVLGSYLTTALANPGIASAHHKILNEDAFIGQKKYELMNQLLGDLLIFCKPCQILRPFGTKHCEDCDVCISSIDHHCPWTGKCIGNGNIGSFYLFILSMMIFMVYSIYVALSFV